VIGGLVVIFVFVALLRGAIEVPPPPQAPHRAAATPAVAARTSASVPTSRTEPPVLPTPEIPDLHGEDTLDPCTAAPEPRIPTDYETVVADGITVAWSPAEVAAASPYDVAVKPITIAYLVNGLLEEAAVLTGTPRRRQLTVVIHPSHAAFLARTGAPPWAAGAYDGSVHLSIKPSADLGVTVPILRHELMHAQLHTAVGCMPRWFNEGMAMYFDGTPPLRDWVAMLRGPDAFDLALLRAPLSATTPTTQVGRVYAASLAMILFLAARGGEPALRAAVQAAQDASRGAADLLDRLGPDLKSRAVLDALARKVFGVGLGDELDAMIKGAVCCTGLRAISELRCRGGAPQPDKSIWIDSTSTPRAACRTAW
jgi:hypothetical protein